MSKTKIQLFLELAKPNDSGISRWVNISEFVGVYKDLQLGNGGSWCRGSSTLAKKYILEFDKSKSSGNSIDAIRLNGFNFKQSFNQTIRKDIKDFYKNQNCVMLGINGNSENTKIEIDHKDGRKDNLRISDVKRQICKKCKETNIRWNAKNIKGNPYAFYQGDENYTQELGCVGCYQYDPVAYRKESVKKIAKEAADFITKKLYLQD